MSVQKLKDLQEYERLRKEWGLFFYNPYGKQVEFHNGGVAHRERLFMAGNQLGKTLSGGVEGAFHATGIYPDWWNGRRFTKPTRAWVAGVTAESTRDNPQRILLGPVGAVGTGMIPKPYIVKTSAARGTPDATETVVVRHVSGGTSQITFKAYADGREKWQGETLDWLWFDEEPPIDIYTEGLTRTNATGGMVFVTFTPLMGMSDVVVRFLNEKSPDRHVTYMTIDDVEHYTEQEKARIIAAYPPHEREARSKGIPLLGSGRVFPIPEEEIAEDPVFVPALWKKLIGLDFGIDHPTAAVKGAWDAENDIVHITACYRVKGASALEHAPRIAQWGRKIPVVWPHDGLQHDKGSGEQLANLYRRLGVNMVSEFVRFPDDRGNGVEAGIQEMIVRMQTGRLKVDRNLHEWWEEFRMYHRKDGKIVKERDDLMAATRYLIMGLRYAMAIEEKPPRPEKYRKNRRATSWMAA